MRYIQYDQMDNDLEINAALDILAEFCTQDDDTTGLPFVFSFNQDPSETEMKILDKIVEDKKIELKDLSSKIPVTLLEKRSLFSRQCISLKNSILNTWKIYLL